MIKRRDEIRKQLHKTFIILRKQITKQFRVRRNIFDECGRGTFRVRQMLLECDVSDAQMTFHVAVRKTKVRSIYFRRLYFLFRLVTKSVTILDYNCRNRWNELCLIYLTDK